MITIYKLVKAYTSTSCLIKVMYDLNLLMKNDIMQESSNTDTRNDLFMAETSDKIYTVEGYQIANGGETLG